MQSFKKNSAFIIFIMLAVIFVMNIFLFSKQNREDSRPYMVEIFRLEKEMEKNYDMELDVQSLLATCNYVKRIVHCESEEEITTTGRYDYCIREINGSLYRFEYDTGKNDMKKTVVICNMVMIIAMVLVLIVLFYMDNKIIRPFHEMEQIPYELAKGNLAIEIPEEQTKYFGRFIWGINMLRENLENRRQKELSMHRDKKLLLLSLTHDIKTPLSVIKLNAQALSKNLYKDEERRMQAAVTINDKVDEIEKYVTDIVSASREEFLDLSVKEEDFYLADVIDRLRDTYENKTSLHKIKLEIQEYKNCLLKGDEDRILEVLQNIMENALKYGDGERISISFERDQGCCLIMVSNTGEGMMAEEIMKVFDSFYRGSNVQNKPGSGLGLYICRQLMTNMNGDIFVSQKENEFKVTVVVRMC